MISIVSGWTRARATTASLVLVAGLVLTAVPAAAAKKPLSPKRWAGSFCTVVVDFQDAMDDVRNDVLSGSDAAVSDIATNPAAVFDYIEELADGLDSAVDASTDAADGIRDLRKPRVRGGAQLKRVLDELLAGGLDEIGTEFQSAQDQFNDIGAQTTDPLVAANELVRVAEEMQATFNDLGSTISSSFAALDEDRSIDPKGLLLDALEDSSSCAPLTS